MSGQPVGAKQPYRGGGGYNPIAHGQQPGRSTGFPPQPVYGALPPPGQARPPRPIYNHNSEPQNATLKSKAKLGATSARKQAAAALPTGNAPRKDATFEAVMKRQNPWLFSAEDLESTPSIVLGGMTEAEERAERTRAMRFLERVARSLRMATVTGCTARLLVQRFYMRHSYTDVPYFDVVGASLFLASKLENDYKRMKDVVIACWRRCNPRSTAEGPDAMEMQRWQETIVNHEQQLLLDIAFDMTIEHPFAFMVDLAERYIVSPQARELAWIAIVDSYETILLLRYSAIAVAGAALFAVCEFLKEKLGNWGDKPIWDVVREMEGEGSTVTELTIRSVAREIHQACKVLLRTAGATLKPVSLPNEGRGVSHQPRAAPLGMNPPIASGSRQMTDYSDLPQTATTRADLEDGEI